MQIKDERRDGKAEGLSLKSELEEEMKLKGGKNEKDSRTEREGYSEANNSARGCNRGVKEKIEHLVSECSKCEHEQKSFMGVVCEQYVENK
ncbi:hypothetical protein FHG87_010480 [Trinorchestia longiramus]|nr:hypothetical protein FHG87_010480 [Trinorchestia longiramus]